MSDIPLVRIANAIRVSAHALWCSTLRGGALSMDEFWSGELRVLEPGRLVYEASTVHYPARSIDAVGLFLRSAREPVFTLEQWEEGGGGEDPIPLETVYYIQTLDGREFRWTNATFYAVPENSLAESTRASRGPAHAFGRVTPELYANYGGARVRVTMASRFGDVGIRLDLPNPHGYDKRVFLPDLSDFGATK
jgi:hypothetical protein